MFDNDPKDLAQTLSAMERLSRERTRFNQIEARQKMAQWVSQDARFAGYDPQRLVERVAHCRSNGAVLNLDDPALKREPSRNRY